MRVAVERADLELLLERVPRLSVLALPPEGQAQVVVRVLIVRIDVRLPPERHDRGVEHPQPQIGAPEVVPSPLVARIEIHHPSEEAEGGASVPVVQGSKGAAMQLVGGGRGWSGRVGTRGGALQRDLLALVLADHPDECRQVALPGAGEDATGQMECTLGEHGVAVHRVTRVVLAVGSRQRDRDRGAGRDARGQNEPQPRRVILVRQRRMQTRGVARVSRQVERRQGRRDPRSLAGPRHVPRLDQLERDLERLARGRRVARLDVGHVAV